MLVRRRGSTNICAFSYAEPSHLLIVGAAGRKYRREGYANTFEFGDMKSCFFVAEVVMVHIRDGLVKNGKIETQDLRPICRLGGPNYAQLGDVITKRAIQATPK
jgi:hypothetical protein